MQIRSFPVKSMDAPAVPRAHVLRSGVADDRRWAVVGQDGAVVTARTDDVLRTVVADTTGTTETTDTADPTGTTPPRLRLPGEPGTVAGAAADSALSALLGRPVRLVAGEAFTEVASVHLVSRQAIDAGHRHLHEAEAACPCSVEEPRANLVLDLVGEGLETGWVGAELVVGAVRLRVSKAPQHCLGVYADVVAEGEVAEGDEVVLVRPDA